MLIFFACSCSLHASFEANLLQEINFARTNPRGYAQWLESSTRHMPVQQRTVVEAVRFLKKVPPAPPLKRSNGLARSATLHLREQGVSGAVGHQSRTETSFSKRIRRFGRWSGGIGENISYGMPDARAVVAQQIIDSGVRSRAHRRNIFRRDFEFVGTAFGTHARYGTMCVVDFAVAFSEHRNLLAHAR